MQYNWVAYWWKNSYHYWYPSSIMQMNLYIILRGNNFAFLLFPLISLKHSMISFHYSLTISLDISFDASMYCHITPSGDTSKVLRDPPNKFSHVLRRAISVLNHHVTFTSISDRCVEREGGEVIRDRTVLIPQPFRTEIPSHLIKNFRNEYGAFIRLVIFRVVPLISDSFDKRLLAWESSWETKCANSSESAPFNE